MTKIYISLFIFLFAGTIIGQQVKQISNINPGDASSYFQNYGSVISKGGILYFSAKNVATGVELYKYDGTNVTLVKDINPGVGDANCNSMFILNNKLIFVATDATSGSEWWTSDGTADGTVMIKDIAVGSASGVFQSTQLVDQNYYKDNNTVYFTGNTGSNFELWKTDGTTAGTVLVKNIAPDSPTVTSSFPEYFEKFKGELYFSCRQGLWKTDGTDAGTIQVKSGIVPKNLRNFNDQKLCIEIDDDLWVSDGTSAGTIKIKTLSSINRNWSGNRYSVVGNQVLFPADDGGGAGDELWKTDGTVAGTVLVKDLIPGSNGEAPQNTVVLKNKLYYKGSNATSGYELFESDGTDAGTKLLKEITPGVQSGFILPTEIITDGKRIFMNAGPNLNIQLWISDGTTIGTKEIEINPKDPAKPLSLYKFGNRMFLFAKSESFGYEPYIVTFDDEIVDEDNDGFASNVDCNDFDPTINPNAPEICDGKDNNCKDGIDEGLTQITYYVDADGDGFGSQVNPLSTCKSAAPTGYVSNSQDCNDADASFKPGATELCDDLDNDCDTAIDEGLTLNTYYIDSDNDGFGAPATSITTCKSVAPSGYVINKTDCNDTNAAINPSATEIANNGIDEDCNGSDLISSTFDPVADKISIYPNPASESINILNENGVGFTVSVFTATGVKISTYQNPKSINVSNYENGVYILEFNLDDNKISRFKKISVSH